MSSEPKAAGLLLVISAASGAGKTTLARRLVDSHDDAEFSISYTTRAPRGREENGVDYHFVDDATFDRMIDEDAFAEWAPVHGRRYGTAKHVVDEGLRAGRVLVFDIDVQGGEQLVARYPGAVAVWVVPPSTAELERRLRGRGTESEAAVAGRLAAAREENRRGLSSYHYLIVNDVLEEAYGTLEAIVTAERRRIARLEARGALPDVG